MSAQQTIELIDTKDISRLLGVTRAHVTNRLTKRPDFPQPTLNLSQKLRKWRKDEVLRFLGVVK